MKLLISSILALVFWSGTLTQDTTKITATYEGFSTSGYEFSFTNDEDEEESIYFETISDEILKQYNLKSSDFKGKEFEVTYKTIEEEDDEGDLTSTDVLVSLKLLAK